MVSLSLKFLTVLFLSLSACTMKDLSFANFGNKDKATEQVKKNLVFVVSGPSGVGKDTVVSRLISQHGGELVKVVSATTRHPRKNERQDIDYHFLPYVDFKDIMDNNGFIEYTKNFGNYYGTTYADYNKAVTANKNVIFIVNYDGLVRLKKLPNANVVSIFIAPPSYEALKHRLSTRSLNAGDDHTSVNERLTEGVKETELAKNYDYILYNCDLEQTVKLIDAVYVAEVIKSKNAAKQKAN